MIIERSASASQTDVITRFLFDYQDMASTKVSREEQVVGNKGEQAGETGLWLIL